MSEPKPPTEEQMKLLCDLPDPMDLEIHSFTQRSILEAQALRALLADYVRLKEDRDRLEALQRGQGGIGDKETTANWDFVAAARTGLPRALETIRQQAARIAELEAQAAKDRALREACAPDLLHRVGSYFFDPTIHPASFTPSWFWEIARLAREAREGTKL